MAESTPPATNRLSLALAAFWRILRDPGFAAKIAKLRAQGPEARAVAPAAERMRLHDVEPNAALQLLGLLQQEGRLIDFLEEDVAAYSDAEIGAATRVVHEGCKKALREHFAITAVRSEPEGTQLTLAEGFDSSAVRLTGNVVGRPPFTGRLTHRGWRVTDVRLPKVAAGHDLSVLAPAEVEL
jgi:hypothetical protein